MTLFPRVKKFFEGGIIMKTFKHMGAMLLTVLLGLCCIVAGCAKDPETSKEPETQVLYTLREGYENGWISKEVLQNIAEMYNAEKSASAALDKAIEGRMEQAIRGSYVSVNRVIDEDVLALDRYFGCFDGFYVASFVEDWGTELWADENSTKIGGVEFLHGESGSNSNLPYLWKEA